MYFWNAKWLNPNGYYPYSTRAEVSHYLCAWATMNTFTSEPYTRAYFSRFCEFVAIIKRLHGKPTTMTTAKLFFMISILRNREANTLNAAFTMAYIRTHLIYSIVCLLYPTTMIIITLRKKKKKNYMTYDEIMLQQNCWPFYLEFSFGSAQIV